MNAAHSLLLDGTVEDPSKARRFVRTALQDVGGDLVDDALVMVSELVSNVVRHGEVPANLQLLFDGAVLRIDIFDSGTALPVLPGATADSVDPVATGGRGLMIVAAMASNWGVVTAPSVVGKTVWFELASTADPGRVWTLSTVTATTTPAV